MPTNKQIIEGIIAQIRLALPEYEVGNFATDIDKNRNSQRRKRFIVRPLGLESSEGPLGSIGRLNLQQRFEVILFDSYTSNLSNDNEVITKTETLIDDSILAFNSIAPNKVRLGGVQNINTLVIDDPDYDDESKLIIVPFSFTIYYFRSI